MSHDDAPSLVEVAAGWTSLLVIERCLRALELPRIRLRPMFHPLPRRIEARLELCVLALLVEGVAELATPRRWPRLRRDLDGRQATERRRRAH